MNDQTITPRKYKVGSLLEFVPLTPTYKEKSVLIATAIGQGEEHRQMVPQWAINIPGLYDTWDYVAVAKDDLVINFYDMDNWPLAWRVIGWAKEQDRGTDGYIAEQLDMWLSARDDLWGHPDAIHQILDKIFELLVAYNLV